MRLSAAHGAHGPGRRFHGPVATAATTWIGACTCTPCAPPHSVLRAPPSACGARRRGERCAMRAARDVDDAGSGHCGMTRRNALLALTGGAAAVDGGLLWVLVLSPIRCTCHAVHAVLYMPCCACHAVYAML
eukprot:138311-Chlamydomonas_euryale.AAC.1